MSDASEVLDKLMIGNDPCLASELVTLSRMARVQLATSLPLVETALPH